MSKISDERLESLLDDYYGSEPSPAPRVDIKKLEKRPVPVPLAFKTRALIAAAGLALVTLLGLTVFMLTQKPATQLLPSELVSAKPTSAERDLGTQAPDPSRGTEAAETAAQPASAPPAALTPDPVSRSDAAADDIVTGTDRQTEPWTEPDARTINPTQATESLNVTEQPTEPESQAGPQAPTQPELIIPTEHELAPVMSDFTWKDQLQSTVVRGTVSKNMLTGDGRVYFRIYAVDGSPVDGGELISDSNLAELTAGKYGTLTAVYRLIDLGDNITKIHRTDCLLYGFYNEDGETLCARYLTF